MQNAYESDIVHAIQESTHDTIMVFKSKLMYSQISLIDMMAEEYNKKIIFGSLREILYNENEKILVIK